MKKLILILIATAMFTANANAQKVTLNISDVEVNGTILKRQATSSKMTYDMDLKFVSVIWRVSYHSDSLGYYGQEIKINGIYSYNKEIVANNSVMVSASTGEPLEADKDGLFPPNAIGQYDYFSKVLADMPIKVNDLIRAYGLAFKNW